MMKRMKLMAGLLVLAGVLALPLAAAAANGPLGIYVTPKIISGVTQMYDVKYQEVGWGSYNFDDRNLTNKSAAGARPREW